MLNQELRQISVRAVSGTTATYNEDWLGLFKSLGAPAGTFDEQFIWYLQQKTGLSNPNLSELMVAFAQSQGVQKWDELGTFDAGLGPTGDATRFDGTNDFMARSTATGAVDGPNALGGIFVKFEGGDDSLQYILSNANGSYVRRNANKTFEVLMQEAGATNVFRIISTGTFDSTDGWLLLEFNNTKMFVNNVDVTGTVTGSGGNIDFTSKWDWGADSTGANKLNGSLFRCWFGAQTADIATNRNLFASSFAPLTARDNYTDGSRVAGAQPNDWLVNPSSSFEVNSGFAGDYIVTGNFENAEAPAAETLTRKPGTITDIIVAPVDQGTGPLQTDNTRPTMRYSIDSDVLAGDQIQLIIDSTNDRLYTTVAGDITNGYADILIDRTLTDDATHDFSGNVVNTDGNTGANASTVTVTVGVVASFAVVEHEEGVIDNNTSGPKVYNIPGGQPAVGELVTIEFCAVSAIGAEPEASGWRRVLGAGGGGSGPRTRVWEKEQDAGLSIGATVTIDSTLRDTRVIKVWSGHGGGANVDGTIFSNNTATATIDPPSHTPAGGADNYVWVAGASNNGQNNVVTGGPTNYTNQVANDSGGAGTNSTLVTSRRELNASTEDPGAYTFTSAGSGQTGYTFSVPGA